MHSIDNENNYREIIKLNLLQFVFYIHLYMFFFNVIFIINNFVAPFKYFFFFKQMKKKLSDLIKFNFNSIFIFLLIFLLGCERVAY